MKKINYFISTIGVLPNKLFNLRSESVRKTREETTSSAENGKSISRAPATNFAGIFSSLIMPKNFKSKKPREVVQVNCPLFENTIGKEDTSWEYGRKMLLEDRMLPSQEELPFNAYCLLSKVFKENPDDVEIEFWLGQAARLGAHSMEQIERPHEIAVKHLANVANKRPQSQTAVLYHAMSVVQYSIVTADFRDFRKAKDAVELIARDSDSQYICLANVVLAECDIILGDIDNAIERVEQVISKKPRDLVALYFLLGTYDETICKTEKRVFKHARKQNFEKVICRMTEIINAIRLVEPKSFVAGYYEAKIKADVRCPSGSSDRQHYAAWNHGILSSSLTFLDPTLKDVSWS